MSEYSNDGFEVIERIEGAAKSHPDYPLLPGDLLVKELGNTFMKEAPGLALSGLVLTEAQQANLRPVRFARHGLSYAIDRSEQA